MTHTHTHTHTHLSYDSQAGVHCHRLVDVKDELGILDQVHPEPQKKTAWRKKQRR